MDPQATRASLLSRLRDPADDAAWREFQACYGELILRYARARGLSQCDAEDIHQIVLLGLCRSLRGFHYTPSRGRFRDYLGRVVKNAVARSITRQRPAPVSLDATGRAAEVAARDEADGLWEREWRNHHLRTAMAEVRRTFEARSITLFERLAAGVPAEALAREHGMEVMAVYQAKKRIGNRLKVLIARQIREEDEPDG
jgi:RNA polymerase sigma-70 factor (ECF subfamily)